MRKQDKKKYSTLMNKIAIAMMINQAIMVILGGALNAVEPFLTDFIENRAMLDLILGVGEGAVYLISFALPINIFTKMNNHSHKEIYEPIEGSVMPLPTAAIAACFSLGAIAIASYINYYAVNLFWNYSDFTMANLWSVDLYNPSQIVIYFANAAVIPAVVEECFFRSTVCKSLTVYGKGTSIIASAALFALMHANIEQIFYAFVAGVLLAWIYVETQSIVFPIIVHMLNNGISAAADIVRAIYGDDVYVRYVAVTDFAIIVLSILSLLGLLMYFNKKGRVIDKLILKPDENGEAVAPLSIKERVSGFFSTGIVLFTAYSLIIMIGLIALSVIAQ